MSRGAYWPTEQARDLLDVTYDLDSAAARQLHADDLRDLALAHAARFGGESALRALERATEAVIEHTGGIR